jgi:hypothetical protein
MSINELKNIIIRMINKLKEETQRLYWLYSKMIQITTN